MTEEVNAPQGAEEQQAPNLSLQDISTFVQIIDLCSKRGGFEGPEMETIGGLRNRTVAFLNAASAEQGEKAPEGMVPAGADLPEEVEGEVV
jgi:hypothetical protein|tara:strand:- start:2373 stop:2645 length:273 start_codon:yes stop_codon:yes gene_type:complete